MCEVVPRLRPVDWSQRPDYDPISTLLVACVRQAAKDAIKPMRLGGGALPRADEAADFVKQFCGITVGNEVHD